MGRKTIPGLIMRAGIWHIDKRIGGRRVCRSTETAELQEAERYLARMMEQTRQAQVYGVRPARTFEQAAAKFVLENQHKRSVRDDVKHLKQLVPLLSKTPLDRVHRGLLQPWIDQRQRQGRASGTINHGLKVVRRILNLACSEWVDDFGLTWIPAAPKIKLLPDVNKRQPHPLDWAEQSELFRELPGYLAQMALFAANTGCRDQEVCQLRWAWEVMVPELETSVFIIPRSRVKNGDERLVVVNRIARSVIEACRGTRPEFVFTFRGHPVTRMMTSAWVRARECTALCQVRVHDLKHTFGRRLRAAGVSFEDRQDLLGHRSGRITTHYSAAELSRLIEAAEKVVERNGQRPELVVLRGKVGTESRKTPASPVARLTARSANR
jgi:integrase